MDVDTMVQQQPRQLDDDQVFNVNINKNRIHKSTYLNCVVIKSGVKVWLHFLLGQSLFKHYKIKVHWKSFHVNTIISCVAANVIGDVPIEHLQCDRSAPELEVLLVNGSRFGRNQTTVMRICDLWMQEGTTDLRGGSHPPQCTTSREDRQIVCIAVTASSVTSRTVAQNIESVTHHSVSARTIRRR
ncbi:transposable element Tcb1 transposase [Trichonephila clavipes]|nr:transposable element Tcb1 transposase [Trichonephila clavipes]